MNVQCRNCGTKIEEGADACSKCGSGLHPKLRAQLAGDAPHPDSPEALVADLKTVVGAEEWPTWRARLAENAKELRERQSKQPEQQHDKDGLPHA